MKYQPQGVKLNREQRRTLNEKVLYLIDSGTAPEAGISGEQGA